MRAGAVCGIAVRAGDGGIISRTLPWRSLTRASLWQKPFLRGFPILLETMLNGIHGLSLSADLLEGGEPGGGLSGWRAWLSLGLALLMAVGLFVAAPHALAALAHVAGLGGDVEGLSFHLWDGLFKSLIFLAYIFAIGFIPDIGRVFQYHGAEHKVIRAYEKGGITALAGAGGLELAYAASRLHPRCGTTFLLFVVFISILVQALAVPALLLLHDPHDFWARHALAIFYKILLVAPIAAISYELIRFSARLDDGWLSDFLVWPGLCLQRLTTREPDAAQLEVARAALYAAFAGDGGAASAARPAAETAVPD